MPNRAFKGQNLLCCPCSQTGVIQVPAYCRHVFPVPRVNLSHRVVEVDLPPREVDSQKDPVIVVNVDGDEQVVQPTVYTSPFLDFAELVPGQLFSSVVYNSFVVCQQFCHMKCVLVQRTPLSQASFT